MTEAINEIVSSSEGEEEAEEEVEFELGEPLRNEKGEALKVAGGDRKGAELFQSISVKKKGEASSSVQYDLMCDCYVEGGNQIYVGKVAAIGRGGQGDKVDENGDVFVVLYWYYTRDEVDSAVKDRYRQIGIDMDASSRCIFFSFHCDEVHPEALRRRVTVLWSGRVPASPDTDLDLGRFCCSFIWDVEGSDVEQSAGQLYSVADSDFLETQLDFQRDFHLQPMMAMIRSMCQKHPYPYPAVDAPATERRKKPKANPYATAMTKEKEEEAKARKRKRQEERGFANERERKRQRALMEQQRRMLKMERQRAREATRQLEKKKVQREREERRQREEKEGLKEGERDGRPPASMLEVERGLTALEEALQHKIASQIEHEVRQLRKLNVGAVVCRLAGAVARLSQAAGAAHMPDKAKTIARKACAEWEARLGKWAGQFRDGKYPGKDQLTALLNRADCFKFAKKLYKEQVDVESLPLLSEEVWRRVGAARSERYRIYRALPSDLSSLVKGGVDAFKPSGQGRRPALAVEYDAHFSPPALAAAHADADAAFLALVAGVTAELDRLSPPPADELHPAHPAHPNNNPSTHLHSAFRPAPSPGLWSIPGAPVPVTPSSHFNLKPAVKPDPSPVTALSPGRGGASNLKSPASPAGKTSPGRGGGAGVVKEEDLEELEAEFGPCHVCRENDTCSIVARLVKCTPRQLVELNAERYPGLTASSRLRKGTLLLLPDEEDPPANLNPQPTGTSGPAAQPEHAVPLTGAETPGASGLTVTVTQPEEETLALASQLESALGEGGAGPAGQEGALTAAELSSLLVPSPPPAL